MELVRYLEMGGWMMYPVALVFMLALPASVGLPIAGYVIGKPRLAFLFAMLLALLGLAAAGLGALGRAVGMRMVEQAVAAVSPDMRALVITVGSGEARVPLAFGLAVAALPLAAACATLGRAVGQKLSKVALAGGLVLGLGVAIAVGALAARQLDLVHIETAIGRADRAEMASLLAAGYEQAARTDRVAGLASLPLILLGAGLLVLGARGAAGLRAGPTP